MLPVPILPLEKPADKNAEPVLPADSNCYVLGSNGLFHIVKNNMFDVCFQVDKFPVFLAEVPAKAKLHVLALPLEELRKVESFFADVYKSSKSEAIVLLFYNPVSKEWKVIAPPQTPKGMHVSYDPVHVIDGQPDFAPFGSIHSHCDSAAFHSSTDDSDEMHFDGLHITIGHVDSPARSYTCRWILHGKVYPCSLSDCVAVAESAEFPKEWLEVIRKPEVVSYKSPTWYGNSSFFTSQPANHQNAEKPAKVKKIQEEMFLPNEQDLKTLVVTSEDRKHSLKWSQRVGCFEDLVAVSQGLVVPKRQAVKGVCDGRGRPLERPVDADWFYAKGVN